MPKLYLSSDHAGFDLRMTIASALGGAGAGARGFTVEDLGPTGPEPVDYPDEAEKVARRVVAESGARGVLVCGSGIGMCIAANKIAGVRAVDAWNTEVARLSRAHNNANVLCLGGRMLAVADALAILDAWLGASFDGGRHQVRVAKIEKLETLNRAAPGPATGANAREDR